MAEEDDGLTLDDLTDVLRIINTAAERGAFKANELSFVGKVYDKYAGFIKQTKSVKPGETPESKGSDSNDRK